MCLVSFHLISIYSYFFPTFNPPKSSGVSFSCHPFIHLIISAQIQPIKVFLPKNIISCQFLTKNGAIIYIISYTDARKSIRVFRTGYLRTDAFLALLNVRMDQVKKTRTQNVNMYLSLQKWTDPKMVLLTAASRLQVPLLLRQCECVCSPIETKCEAEL